MASADPSGGDAASRFYTFEEVAQHNQQNDCWLVLFGRVVNVTDLVGESAGSLAEPMLARAGDDVSHWFDPDTKDLRSRVDPATALPGYYLPEGRFVHVPPTLPLSSWRTDFGQPWWKDESRVVGRVSRRTRKILIVNTLTGDRHIVESASEETVGALRDRFVEWNAHAKSYTWKALLPVPEEQGQGGAAGRAGDAASGAPPSEDRLEFRPLDLTKTLHGNGLEDDAEEMAALGMDPEAPDHLPTIHLYFDDDLTHA